MNFLIKIRQKIFNCSSLFLRPIALKVLVELCLGSVLGCGARLLKFQFYEGRSDFWRGIYAAGCVFDFSSFAIDRLNDARKEMVPDQSQGFYLKQVLRCRAKKIKNYQISKNKIKEYLGNPKLQKKSCFLDANWAVNMHGIENYSLNYEKKNLIIILSWHHGPYAAAERILTEYIPGLLRVSHAVYPYKKNISLNVADNPLQGMFAINKALDSGESVLTYFDGLFGKRSLKCELYGVEMLLSESILNLAREREVRLLPYTSYINKNNAIDLNLGPSLFERDELRRMKNEDALLKILNFFKNDLKANCPWAVNPCILEDHYKSNQNGEK